MLTPPPNFTRCLYYMALRLIHSTQLFRLSVLLSVCNLSQSLQT